mmetsp:Transcript_40372/g.52906  ORF Transcript_40372/g.52906 Transcript_40372/m.52906 type:complete len:293 (-) Transcript_40372:2976-3854(-)
MLLLLQEGLLLFLVDDADAALEEANDLLVAHFARLINLVCTQEREPRLLEATCLTTLDGDPHKRLIGVGEEIAIVLELIFVELAVVQVGDLSDAVILCKLVSGSQHLLLVGTGGALAANAGRVAHEGLLSLEGGALLLVVTLHDNLNLLHIVVANRLVKTGRGRIDLLIDLEVSIEDVFGKEDVLVGLLAGLLHLHFLDLALDCLGLLLLLLELDLLGEQLLLQAGLHGLLLGRRLLLLARTLLQVPFKLLLRFYQIFALNQERVVLAEVFEERLVVAILGLHELVLLVTAL